MHTDHYTHSTISSSATNHKRIYHLSYETKYDKMLKKAAHLRSLPNWFYWLIGIITLYTFIMTILVLTDRDHSGFKREDLSISNASKPSESDLKLKIALREYSNSFNDTVTKKDLKTGFGEAPRRPTDLTSRTVSKPPNDPKSLTSLRKDINSNESAQADTSQRKEARAAPVTRYTGFPSSKYHSFHNNNAV